MYFEEEAKCPKCGALNIRIPPASQEREADVDSLAKAYSTVSGARELTSGASDALGGTIDWLGTIPPEQQESMGITEFIPEITATKTEVDGIRSRLEGVEERLSHIEEERFEEARRERELFIPSEVLDRLPTDVSRIIESIRKAFKRGVPEFCPTYIRKALIAAIVIRFDMDGKREMLSDDTGNPYGVPRILELARQEGYITSYMRNQLRREVRVFGDIGAHDYRIDFEEEDVIPLFKLLRLALEHIYHEET